MKKILFYSSVLITSLLADNNLGTSIGKHTIDKVIEKQTITKESIAKKAPVEAYTKRYTKTVIPNASNTITNTHTFKSDDHRYDKRFQDFDYDNNGYYSDDGYYYGYYDNTGYFYNNIFFTYNSLYTYNDRCHRRGYFRPRHHHHRTYRHHRVNNWNRVHHYREPNHIVYGHYYDQRYYPSRYRRDTARMTIPRTNYSRNQTNSSRSITNHNTRVYDNRYNSREHRNHRTYNHNSRDRASMQIHRNTSTTQHTGSRPKRNVKDREYPSTHTRSTAHMQMSR